MTTGRFIGSWLLLGLLAGHGAVIAQDDLTGEQVRTSIDRAIKYLMSEQDRRTGRWREIDSRYRGGVTALSTLALINAGVSPENDSIKRAIRSLDTDQHFSDMNYIVSLRIMVFAAANPQKYKLNIQRLTEVLVSRQVSDGKFAGGWSYREPARPDASNTQFVLLALHEARLAGVKIDKRVWELSRSYWLSLRDPNTGGFNYGYEGSPSTGSMTCAGIASMIIIEENLKQESSGIIECCGQLGDQAIVNQAFDWLDQKWTFLGNPDQGGRYVPGHLYYYLYSIERAGRLSGRRFVGKNRDWYREVAKFLLTKQQRFGGWRGVSMHGENMEPVATSFALLFLAKGLRPVVIGKYQHGSGQDWDRHPKGIHYLTRELESQWKQKLNWQAIKGDIADTNELLQAPVIFFSGRDNLALNQQQKARLKEYIENGGFVFAEACKGEGCGDAKKYDERFKQLMLDLFPDSELQPLPESHPIWNAQKKIFPSANRPLLALQTSCRTAVIYCPANLSCLWAMNQDSIKARMLEDDRKQVEYAVQLGVNVVTYATNRRPQQKLDTPTVFADSKADRTRILVMPKLAHSGGADDAPNAWNNILNRAKHDVKLKIKIEKELIQPKLEQLQDYPIVFMHGRSRFTMTEVQREDLKTWLEAGGFLFADAICGSDEFGTAFRDLIKKMFPDGDWKEIPANHEIWTTRYDGYNIQRVTLREPVRSADGLTYLEQKVAPRMEGLFVDGRIVAVFSKYDLSCAMESATASQCKGYLKDDASKIGVNVLLYALQ